MDQFILCWAKCSIRSEVRHSLGITSCPGWLGEVFCLSTVPVVDLVLLAFGKSN